MPQTETATTVPAISVVTQLELIAGIRNKSELRNLVRFLKRFAIIKIDGPICDRAVALLERCRLSHGLLMADAFIAATALQYRMPLVTKNKKDYQFIRGLVLPPYP